MSHSFEAPGGTEFHSDSDVKNSVVLIHAEDGSITIPGSDILEFVANYVMNEKINRLESAEALEILLGRSDPT